MSKPSRIENVALAVHRHTETRPHASRYRSMVAAYVARLSSGWHSDAIRAFLRREQPDRTDAEFEDELDKLRRLGDWTRPIDERRALGMGITTDPAVPLDTKYVTLVAVHERYCPCLGLGLEFWFPPPPGYKDPPGLKDPHGKAGGTDADWDYLTDFAFLKAMKEDAGDLDESHLPGIERMLTDVAEDLKNARLNTSADAGPSETGGAIDGGGVCSLRPCHRRAWDSLKWVEAEHPSLDTRAAQWEQLHEHGCPAYESEPVPAMETWCRYVREAERNVTRRQNTSRRGRAHGKTIVEANQI